MYFLFVWYIVRMVSLALGAVMAIPRGILMGLASGVQKSGFRISVFDLAKQFENSGIKGVFFDAIADIFDQRLVLWAARATEKTPPKGLLFHFIESFKK